MGRQSRAYLPRLGVLLLTLFVCGCQRTAPPVTAGAPIDALGVLHAADTPGFQSADTPRAFAFPQDHGPHPDFRDEWWYFTGQLNAANGDRFGFELTFFRLGLLPPAPLTPGSAWRARQAYAAHFAITDVKRARFFNATRYARDALGLAGAQAPPFAVHVADWSVIQTPDQDQDPDTLHWRLTAADGPYQLTLELSSGEPPVLNGAAGLSRKSEAPGAASYYYSMPRIKAAGRLDRDGERLPVTGQVWLDREWGSGSLGADQRGWDWYSLTLSDGSTLMFYALRDVHGLRDAHSAGTYVDAGGNAALLANGDVDIAVLGHWDSPRGGRYPAGWKLTVRSLGLDLTLTPLLADQELATQPRYWEGAVQASGQRRGAPLSAQGYVELVGYARDQATPSTASASTPPGH